MLSGCSSAAISRTSAQNRASVSPGQRGGGVDDDGDGVDALRMHRGQIEAAVDETAGWGHSSYNRGARHRSCSGATAIASRGCSDALAGSCLLDCARRVALRPCEARGLMHGLVPRLLLGGCVQRRFAGLAGGAVAALVRVHDLAGAARVVAGGHLPGWFRARAAAARSRFVLVLRTAVAGWIGRGASDRHRRRRHWGPTAPPLSSAFAGWTRVALDPPHRRTVPGAGP